MGSYFSTENTEFWAKKGIWLVKGEACNFRNILIEFQSVWLSGWTNNIGSTSGTSLVWDSGVFVLYAEEKNIKALYNYHKSIPYDLWTIFQAF